MQRGLDDLQSEGQLSNMIDAEALYPRQPSWTGSHELISPFSPPGKTLTHQIFLLPCDEQGLCGYTRQATRTAELSRLTTLFPRSFWNFIRLIAFLMSQVRFDVRPLLRPPRSWCRPASTSIEILLLEQSAQVTRLNAYRFLLHNEHTITASRSTSFVLLRSSANSSLDCGSVLDRS
ncbi:hypothetical protein BJX66DRAFT_107311 [Aspergillus keveii]|uniref:Uncharacterized protein n=1 Tax=Aspergillus keveii TaxID=714993 RepID=A0ABR4GFC2_9EURO